MKWEYLVFQAPVGTSEEDTLLKGFGEEGWEAYAVLLITQTTALHYMKRKVSQRGVADA